MKPNDLKPNDLSVSGNRPFFIPGGTLPGDAPSYVTRQADHNLLEGLRGGQFCYVLTSRQMGKSSLMVRTANRLREEGVAVAVLDLTALGQNLSVEQWYFGLLEQLGRHLRLEDELDDYWQSHKSMGPMQRWMAAIRDVVLSSRSQQIVVFVDEIDIVRSLPFSTDEFFAAIRECYNRRAQEPQYAKLTFCLLGVATPNDLIKNTLMTPFNIGRRIELTDFAPEEAAPLSVGISVTERDGRALLNRVLYWTGGHPYLTQRLCSLVAEDTATLREEDVDRLCADLFLAHKARESDDNLQFVRNRLLQSEVDLTALLDLYARVRQDARVADDETNALTSVLKLSGIARVERGELKVRNRIYARVFDRAWVRAHMPDAELQRQRAAYRKGLARALALSSTVLMVVLGLAIYGFSQARRANHNADLAHKATLAAQVQTDTAECTSYIARMNLIQRDWDINDIADVVDLLEDTRQSRFQGFEWSYWNRLIHIDLFTLNGHTASLTSVAYSPDGKRIVTGSTDNTAKVWDAATGQEILTLKHPGSVYSVAFSPDGKRIVTGSYDTTASVWDATTGRETLTLKNTDRVQPMKVSLGRGVQSVAYSPDGKHIVIGSNDNNTAKVWDATTGRETLTLKGHISPITSVAFSPDGKRIVTGSFDCTAKVWDAATGQETLTLKGHTDCVHAVAFSPDGKRIVTGSWDGTAKVWDAATGQEMLTLKHLGHFCEVYSVAFSPDSKRIVTGSWDKTAKLWDADTGRETFTFKGHIAPIFSTAFSPDGKRIVTGSMDSKTKVWDAQTGRETLTLKGETGPITTVAFSPDGKRIVTGTDGNTVANSSNDNNIARVWDATTGRETLTLKGHISPITSVAFSPDGKRIVTGSFDCTAKVWDAVTGQETLTLKHLSVVTSVAFSPDSKCIVTGSYDHTAKIWYSDEADFPKSLRP